MALWGLVVICWATICLYLYPLYWHEEDVSIHLLGIGVTAGVSALGMNILTTLGNAMDKEEPPNQDKPGNQASAN